MTKPNIVVPKLNWRRARSKRNSTKYIVVHNSASTGINDDAALFHAWHLERDNRTWLGLGYNFVIKQNGTIEQGREHWAAGGHANQPANKESIGICLSGNFDKNHETPAQWASLVHLCAWLCEEYNLPGTAIKGHRDCPNNSTSCPGKNFYPKLPKLRQEVVAAMKGIPVEPKPTEPQEWETAKELLLKIMITDGSNPDGAVDRKTLWVMLARLLKYLEK